MIYSRKHAGVVAAAVARELVGFIVDFAYPGNGQPGARRLARS
jgi:hypothetical protein